MIDRVTDLKDQVRVNIILYAHMVFLPCVLSGLSGNCLPFRGKCRILGIVRFRLQEGVQMVTIKDVAAMANVSTATVSRAINSPELVSDERREAVQRAIAALNYHPNDIARSLQKSESYIVGVLVPDITNIFTTDVISAIGTELQQHGYAMFLAISNHNPQTEQALVNLMMEKRVAGIIMLGSRRPNEESDRLINNAALSVPCLLYTSRCV